MLPHDDRGPSVLAAIWTVTALATLFIAIRVYCKFLKSKRLYWDDAVLIASYASHPRLPDAQKRRLTKVLFRWL